MSHLSPTGFPFVFRIVDEVRVLSHGVSPLCGWSSGHLNAFFAVINGWVVGIDLLVDDCNLPTACIMIPAEPPRLIPFLPFVSRGEDDSQSCFVEQV